LFLSQMAFELSMLRTEKTTNRWQRLFVSDLCSLWTSHIYTALLAVRVGNTIHDLIELVEIELHEPTGWSVLPLVWLDGSPVRTFMLQLAVLANHQNGRDTHLRAIRLHSPIEPRGLDVLSPFEFPDGRMFTSFR
uniref:Anaphase-promoting complex subunit 10 n=1 Tax=Echinostoma caproni TaxID=27848 RepID=A0A183BBC2_9TREM